MTFIKSHFQPQDKLRTSITEAYRQDETSCVQNLISFSQFSPDVLSHIEKEARQLVMQVRKERMRKGGLDAFLQEYDLSSKEGIALMCLAEALLRTPDDETIDKLIRDKVVQADWQAHAGKSESFFVNAATWGLMLTGKALSRKEEKTLATAFKSFVNRVSEPVVRKTVREAMKILGYQFVMGRTMDEALKRALVSEKKGYRHSYDMLGEAARTAEDAERYMKSYEDAIIAVGKDAQGKTIDERPNISVKLSALHPRYEFSQAEWVTPVLVDRLKKLALQAKAYHIGLTVDAEEADRLDLSLDIFEAVFNDTDLVGWEGLGLALQAYQKRAFYVLDWIIHLAKKQNRRIMVRLVKGAYWDYEIKDSQVKGLEGYPVFTRKVNTDISYIACAKKMAEAGHVIFPQFATHNAHTVAVIMELMKGRHDFEFQALHGMGHALYDFIVGKENKNIPCRIYAPVGTHEDLLAYLVRRLLENGANTSFVNRIIDEQAPIKDLVENPIEKIKNYSTIPNSRIPLPIDLFGKDRKNSMGYDLSNRAVQMQLAKDMDQAVASTWYTQPTIGKKLNNKDVVSMTNPSDRRQIIGEVMEITPYDIETALQRADAAALHWNLTPVDERAKILERIADLFEQHMPTLMAMAVREAGKNIFDAQGEVREAVDYCRYYAEEARRELIPKKLPGPTGELNQLQLRGRGVIACISPWNFPLAIFSGQITAALVTGNAVIAKPAKQTSLIAGYAVKLMYEAGVPENVLQLLPGSGSLIGEKLIPDPRIKGVVFTGSTETGRLINQTLANREGSMIPLIAETGGQNAMIVDATALPEQVVVDALISAFNSAGQRCSALRVLFLQEDIADKVIHMLKGAMEEWQMGDPELLKTDVGPVIDESAKKKLEEHAAFLKKEGKLIYQMELTEECQHGTFFAPCAFEISTLKLLKHEVFGPILHVIRYAARDLDQVIDDINQTGYGLTMGIHSRIDETIEYIKKRVHVGNIYVNRNVIGAVVGVQPFGGENLSGTGPKAGGPHYLLRFCVERTFTVNTTAAGGNATLMAMGED